MDNPQDLLRLADEISREEANAWLVEHCGRGLPYDVATDLPSALHGAAYTLRQIEGTNKYMVHIGQCGPAASGIRWLLEYVARVEIASAHAHSTKESDNG